MLDSAEDVSDFEAPLKELGYIRNENLELIARSAQGDPKRLGFVASDGLRQATSRGTLNPNSFYLLNNEPDVHMDFSQTISVAKARCAEHREIPRSTGRGCRLAETARRERF